MTEKILRVASDVGGTFTDIVWCEIDERTGQAGAVFAIKTDTTPPKFEEGVLAAIDKAAIELENVSFIAHGSTVVINALTERKGSLTGLITTAGFRDVLEIARGNRPDLFNFNFRKPPPFVERHLRREVRERTTVDGQIRLASQLEDIDDAVAHFREEDVKAVAICFLHSYANPANEKAVADRLSELMPEAAIIASHEISREWREYERTSTTVLSAYVAPVVDSYIGGLERKLNSRGLKSPLYLMQSNGGIATVEAAKNNPITMVESGPSAGIFAAAHLGKLIDEPNLLVLDIGGTTAKCALVESGEVKVSTDYYIERDRQNPGYPIQTPVAEIVEIGNGGGSIAWIDDGGKLHVGPQSAGAQPGPAAYGRGGTEPTTTDANLLLGRIDPASFVGGEVEPDWDAIERAFAPLTKRLDVTQAELARGIIRIADANMVNALRLVSTNKGYDPRDFSLLVCGGGGAMHGVALAEELGVRRVIVPVNSSAFSAWGMLLSDLRRDYLRTSLIDVGDETESIIGSLFETLENEAVDDFLANGAKVTPRFERLVDMRYFGQEHTVKVSLTNATHMPGLIENFHAAHEKRYTYRLDNPVQIVNAHLVARVEVTKPVLAERQSTGANVDGTNLGQRSVDFDRYGTHNAAIYDGLALEPDMTFCGPAIVQEPSVTLVVPPDRRVTLDRFGNYHVHLDELKG